MAFLSFPHRSSPFSTPREIKTPFLLSLLLIGVSGLITVTSYAGMQSEIPLFYSRSNPSQQLVAKHWIFLFPLATAIVVLVNRILLYFLHKYDHQLTVMYAWTTFVLICFLNFALIRILYVIS